MLDSKTHPITIRVSTETLNDIDWRLPDRRRSCRERFLLDALEAYLGHPENVYYHFGKDGRYKYYDHHHNAKT